MNTKLFWKFFKSLLERMAITSLTNVSANDVTKDIEISGIFGTEKVTIRMEVEEIEC